MATGTIPRVLEDDALRVLVALVHWDTCRVAAPRLVDILADARAVVGHATMLAFDETDGA